MAMVSDRYGLAGQVRPKVGDRVRITVEDEVTQVSANGFDVGANWYVGYKHLTGPEQTVEIIEPKWRPGDVIACEHGHTYIRSHEDRWMNADGFHADGPCIAETATLLIRGGKPVSA